MSVAHEISSCGWGGRLPPHASGIDLTGCRAPLAQAFGIRTTRNLALPLIIRANPSAARSSGNVSIIGRICEATLNFSVSSESGAVPDGQPAMERREAIRLSGETSIGSADA